MNTSSLDNITFDWSNQDINELLNVQHNLIVENTLTSSLDDITFGWNNQDINELLNAEPMLIGGNMLIGVPQVTEFFNKKWNAKQKRITFGIKNNEMSLSIKKKTRRKYFSRFSSINNHNKYYAESRN